MNHSVSALPWFFCAELAGAGVGHTVTLGEEEARHAKSSRRLGSADRICLFDGTGMLAAAHLKPLGRGQLAATIEEVITAPQPAPQVTLASALPKGDRMSVMLSMATQLGMTAFVPLACERSVVEPGEGFEGRARRIMIEACKQSRRAHLPTIASSAAPVRIAGEFGAATLLARLGGRPLAQVSLQDADGTPPRRLAAMIGPEGGFTDAEVEAARAAGAQIVSLGPAVLRIETAAAAMLAWIRLTLAAP